MSTFRAAAAAVATTLLLSGCTSTADRAQESSSPRERGIEPADFAPAAAVVESSDAAAPLAAKADAAWLADTAAATGIPERMLAGYAGAAIVSIRENPGCGASWNTLAGIGRVESVHGEIFGGIVDAGGTVDPPVFGVALDGDGLAAIPDSDAGAIDGDAVNDRAVGPMQMIPATWRNWHVDGGGDGIESPHNIDDAALAAIHYLCRAGGTLATPEGWRSAVFAWNRSDAYVGDVGGWANRYAEDAAAEVGS